MALTLVEAEVEVTVDGTKVPEKIARDTEANADGPMSRAGLGLAGKLFAGFMAFKGVQAAGDWIGGAITGGSDLNETINKSSVIFGEHAASIAAFGNNAAKNLGLSKQAALQAASGFGDMFTQIGFTQDAAAAMSQSVVIAAADLGSFNNLETADVTERISAAFRGEYDSLQAVIPNINAARVESEALAATGKKTAAELTAQEKAAAVLAIIHQDGARAMGDFARTSDDYANSTKIAQAQLTDLQAEVGTALLPTMTDLMMLVRDQIIPAFQGAATWIGDNIETIKGVATAVGIAAATFGTLSAAVSVYNGIMGVYRGIVAAGTVATWALNTAQKANVIGIVIGLISALVGGIVWLATETTFFQDLWTNVTTALGVAWQWLWDNVLSPVFTAIGTAFQWLGDNVFAPVGSFIAGVIDGIGLAFNWFYQNVITPVVTGIMLYIGLWAAAAQWLWDTILSPVINAIGAAFNWLGTNVFGPIGSFINDVFTGMGIAFNWLYANAIMPVANFITSAIQGMGIVFGWLNTNIVQPVFQAVGAAFNWVWNSIISPVINFISTAIRNVGNTVQSVFGGIGSFIGTAFNTALNVVKGPINGIIGLVNSAIRGLNSLSVTIPDWVPVVGGQTWGLSIPTIPMLARGAASAPGAFIAGEAGPELIVGAQGARVYPHNETRRMVERSSEKAQVDATIIVKSDNPELAGRKFARALTERLGI